MGNDDRSTGSASGDSTDEDLSGVPVAEALSDHPAIGKDSDETVPHWLDTVVQYIWRGLIVFVGIAVIILVLTRLRLVSLPILVALILATLCVPPARRLERMGLPRLAAAFIIVIGGIGSVAGVIALLFPTFIEQGRQLQPAVAEGVDSVLMWLEEGPIGYDRTELEQLFNQAIESLEGSAGTIASSVGTIAIVIGQGIAALALAIVLLFFFVKDGEQIVGWFIKLVPEHHSNTVRAAGARGWVALSGFVRGTALVALLDALGIGIGLYVLDVPAYLPLSVLIFFGGFIPVIGATVTGSLAVLVALASGGLGTALAVTGLVLLVQQVEGNVLQPTIMRRAVALHPVVILGVLTAGAVLVGVVGAFLAVPLAAVVAAVGNELRLRHELAKRGGVAGPSPIGGPGVDPSTVRVQFPADTQLRAAGRRRDGKPRQRRTRQRTREHVEREIATIPLDAPLEAIERPHARRAAGPDADRTDSPRTRPKRTDPTRTDLERTDQERTDPERTDPERTDRKRTDPGDDRDDDDPSLRTADLKVPIRRKDATGGSMSAKSVEATDTPNTTVDDRPTATDR